MAGTTNILQFNPSQANQVTDAAYLTDSVRTNGAGVDGIWPSDSANKTLYQVSTVVAALAQMMANKGFSISDANYSVLVAQLANILTTADSRGGVQTLTWSSSMVLNAAAFTSFAIPLQGAATLTVTGAVAGQVYVLLYTQDVSGGHTVTFNTGFGDGAVQPDPAVSITSLQVFVANASLALVPIGPLISLGGINGTPVGNSAPSTGAFTTLTAATPASSDNSTNAATTAWSKFGFVASLSTPGYIKLPSWLSGFTIQWGNTGSIPNDTPTSVSFPLTFANACLSVVAVDSFLSNKSANWSAYNYTASNFTARPDNNTAAANWIAVGY